MKRFLIILAVIGMFIVGGFVGKSMSDTDIPKPSEVICTCGHCDLPITECKCPIAKKMLKKYKGA